MKKQLSKRMREDFAQRYALSTETGSACALAAGYSKRHPNRAPTLANYLLRQPSVAARVAELRKEAATKAIANVTERLERLSKIVRGDNANEAIRACRELNLMERIYREGIDVQVQQKVLNIQVITPKSKELSGKIIEGERT